MSLANCKHCGKLYIQARSAFCSDCQSEHDHMYRELRAYIKQHPNSTVLDVHTKTGIPITKVLELRKEEFIPFG